MTACQAAAGAWTPQAVGQLLVSAGGLVTGIVALVRLVRHQATPAAAAHPGMVSRETSPESGPSAPAG